MDEKEHKLDKKVENFDDEQDKLYGILTSIRVFKENMEREKKGIKLYGFQIFLLLSLLFVCILILYLNMMKIESLFLIPLLIISLIYIFLEKNKISKHSKKLK